ncbi:Transcription initiation factor TFIID subunit 11 [Pleurostoma richardsiae]|uniref:Transcription initiation factor TFIID subunit 11 n=1 Tax=Pleurostoma richardsiae TaxID=41990 RepID=A0AA38S799_9PEZI|nr:Transcription initiation factor TFIID subunit 11 [Pleurostoma richardsiae]
MATQQQSAKNVKWVEGLRGMASVLVIMTHISRAFDYGLFFPQDTPEAAPRLLQLPILRVPWQGRIGVPIFAFLTGFVCALKPLKLARQGRQGQGDALMAIARSAFRRPPRLVLPAAIATTISMVLTVLGAYVSSSHCDSFWVRFDTPNREPTLWLEVCRYFRVLLSTWTNSDNVYDRHQWAMRPLLVGAFQVYVLLAATMGMRFKYRMVVHALLMTYWWLNREVHTETFGAMIALGTLLADLSQHRPTQAFIAAHHRVLSLVVAPCLILTGLYIGSYPQEHEDWAPWSRWLMDYFVNMNPPEGQPRGSLLVPEGTDPRRRFTAANIQLFAVAVFVSPMLREALSSRWLLWLGHHSFAVYLTHGTILRTVGIWVAYGIVPHYAQREDGSWETESHVAGPWRVRLAILVFICLTYSAAWAWMRWVDTACARATKWLEARVFEPEDENDHEAAEKGYGRVNGVNGNGYPGGDGGHKEMNGGMNGGANGHTRHPSMRDRMNTTRQGPHQHSP